MASKGTAEDEDDDEDDNGNARADCGPPTRNLQPAIRPPAGGLRPKAALVFHCEAPELPGCLASNRVHASHI